MKLLQIAQLPLSFKNAKELRGRAELLPMGPQWHATPVPLQTYPTKMPVQLYHRDPIDCLQSLLHSPLVADHIDFTPFRLYKSAERIVRVYTEWLSGDAAWNFQVSKVILH